MTPRTLVRRIAHGHAAVGVLLLIPGLCVPRPVGNLIILCGFGIFVWGFILRAVAKRLPARRSGA